MNLSGYCGTDRASSLENMRSISVYCFILSHNGPAISWKSKKHSSVALSICAAEHMALSVAFQEVSYLRKCFNDIIQSEFEPVKIKNDNQGATTLVKNLVNPLSIGVSLI